MAAEASAGEEEIIQFLQDHTLVGLLPVPHPILCRKYQPSNHIGLWFTTFLWGTNDGPTPSRPPIESER